MVVAAREAIRDDNGKEIKTKGRSKTGPTLRGETGRLFIVQCSFVISDDGIEMANDD